MKTRHFGLISAAVLAGGCTHLSSTLKTTRTELKEHSRALTTGVVDSLQAETNRGPEVEFALKLAREDQRIEGLPLDPIDPADPPKLDSRFHRIEKLLARERRGEQRLVELGVRQEASQNAGRLRSLKWWGSGTVLIGGFIALFVFVPAALPILGRLLAWVVGKIPALAGALGVVSVKAFDAVVRGVERGKDNAPAPLANTPQPAGLEPSLSREMDAAHKELVRTRKAAIL